MVCSEDGKVISSPLKGFNIRIKAKCMKVKNILAPDFEKLNCDPLSQVYYKPPTNMNKTNRRALTPPAVKSQPKFAPKTKHAINKPVLPRIAPALSPALGQPNAPVLPKAPAFAPSQLGNPSAPVLPAPALGQIDQPSAPVLPKAPAFTPTQSGNPSAPVLPLAFAPSQTGNAIAPAIGQAFSK